MTGTRVPPVLVTGATGRVGRVVVDLLTDAGVPVRALTRRSEAAALPAAVEVVSGDLTVPESLDAGAAGRQYGLPRLDRPAGDRSGRRRAPRALTRGGSSFSPRRTRRRTRSSSSRTRWRSSTPRSSGCIAAAGLESTIIRPGMFASNALFWWAPAIRADGVVRWPYGAAETAPIDERDVAAVAARALYEDGHAGGDYVLTGPESLSQAEQVSIIGDVIGRRIAFEELSPDEFRRETAEAGRARPWTCCSPRGARRWDGRRS